MANKDTKTFEISDELKVLFAEYIFFQKSYEGGRTYINGNYLTSHKRESDSGYKRRKEQSSYVNFCKDVIDILTSYLFKEEPTREFKNPEDEALVAFLKDADLDGRSWNKLVRESSKAAGTSGIMGVIVDKPLLENSDQALSKKAELDVNIRPYVAVYLAQCILDWVFKRDEFGVNHLNTLVLKENNNEGSDQIKVWTRAKWELWERKGFNSTDPYELIDEGENPLGIIPFVLLRNRDTLKKMHGLSDIADIAYVNKRIYQIDSLSLEVMETAGFPQLEGSETALSETAGDGEEIQIGSESILVRAEGELEGFRYVEPTHSSLEQMLKHRNSSIDDIKNMAKTGQTEAQKSTPESGVALELRFQQLTAILTEKADNQEEFEEKVFKFFGLWEDDDLEANIEYPRRFGVRDLEHDLDVAIMAKAAVPSRTFAAELSKGIAVRMLPNDTDPKILKQIEEELDQGPVEVGDETDGDDDFIGEEDN